MTDKLDVEALESFRHPCGDAFGNPGCRCVEKALASLQAQLAQAKAEAWEDVARFGIEWMKNPGGIDARFIAACREKGAALRVKHEE